MSEKDNFRSLIERTSSSPQQIVEATQRIHRELLTQSPNIQQPNFEVIAGSDLSLLFDLYDKYFFQQLCRESLRSSPLHFRASSRMTRAGGKTSRTIYRDRPDTPVFEISVSSTLLFDTFDDVERTIVVTGIECHDRLQALQRIFEHEMIHLIEMLLWNKSSCSQKRFQTISAKFFGHTDYRHELVTPRERALTLHGVKTGSVVQFEFEGVQHTGTVNRITKRATVLVENRKGQRYSDGKRYVKYYIPVEYLTLLK